MPPIDPRLPLSSNNNATTGCNPSPEIKAENPERVIDSRPPTRVHRFSRPVTRSLTSPKQDVKIKEENFEPTARRLPTRGEQSSNKETRCVDVERQQCGEGSGTENNCNVTADLAPQPEAGHSSSLEDTSATQVDRYNATDGWRCKDCNKTFTTDHHLIAHQQRHMMGKKPFKCSQCGRGFSVSSNLHRHLRDVHVGFRPHSCDSCSEGFYSEVALRRHMLNQHHTGSNKKEFQCADCDKVFAVNAVLQAHRVLHTGERPFICSRCSRGFSFRSNLLRHMKIHTGDKPHKCDECSCTFIERKSLLLHVTRQHRGLSARDQGMSFACEVCDKLFSSRTNLFAHRAVHSGIKPYACTACGKKFSMASNMRRHAKTHLGLKPFQCDDCQKCFTEKKSLLVHQRKHTGEKPYTCHICGKAFAQRGTLQSHMPVHIKDRTFKCTHCAKSFLRKSHLTFHLKMHTMEPKHNCQQCEKKFYRKSDLDRHGVKHSVVKPFICSLCGKGFTRLQYLRDHCQSHASMPAWTLAETTSRLKQPEGRSEAIAPADITKTEETTSQIQLVAAADDEIPQLCFIPDVTSHQPQETIENTLQLPTDDTFTERGVLYDTASNQLYVEGYNSVQKYFLVMNDQPKE